MDPKSEFSNDWISPDSLNLDPATATLKLDPATATLNLDPGTATLNLDPATATLTWSSERDTGGEDAGGRLVQVESLHGAHRVHQQGQHVQLSP